MLSLSWGFEINKYKKKKKAFDFLVRRSFDITKVALSTPFQVPVLTEIWLLPLKNKPELLGEGIV